MGDEMGNRMYSRKKPTNLYFLQPPFPLDFVAKVFFFVSRQKQFHCKKGTDNARRLGIDHFNRKFAHVKISSEVSFPDS